MALYCSFAACDAELYELLSLKRLSGLTILLRSNGLYGYAFSQEKWLRSIWWLVISVWCVRWDFLGRNLLGGTRGTRRKKAPHCPMLTLWVCFVDPNSMRSFGYSMFFRPVRLSSLVCSSSLNCDWPLCSALKLDDAKFYSACHLKLSWAYLGTCN